MAASAHFIQNPAGLVEEVLKIFRGFEDVLGYGEFLIVPYRPATHAFDDLGTEAALATLVLLQYLVDVPAATFYKTNSMWISITRLHRLIDYRLNILSSRVSLCFLAFAPSIDLSYLAIMAYMRISMFLERRMYSSQCGLQVPL